MLYLRPLAPRLMLGGALCLTLLAASSWQLAPGRLGAVGDPVPELTELQVAESVAAVPPSGGVVSRSARGASRLDDGARESDERRRPETVRYKVQPGDTLLSLAQRYRTRVSNIASLNPGLHPDRIKAGETLVIRPGAQEEMPLVLPPDPEPTTELVEDDPGLRIWAPYRSQFDGSPYEGGNCGPAALAMAMAHFGEWWSTEGLRHSINRVTGDWSYDGGSDWPSMVAAAQERGFRVHGPYNEQGNFRYWDLDDLLAHTEKGRPVILLVRYRALPGHENASWWGDHYIVFLGVTKDGGVIYHDPAFYGDEGAYRIMEQAQLDRAWSKTWIHQDRTAMALIWAK